MFTVLFSVVAVEATQLLKNDLLGFDGQYPTGTQFRLLS